MDETFMRVLLTSRLLGIFCRINQSKVLVRVDRYREYMATSLKKHGISLESVTFYLDGVERDRLDSMGAGAKTGEVIALRDQLLKLPDEAFNAAVKSVKALVAESKDSSNAGKNASFSESKEAGRKLYDETRARGSGGARGALAKVTPN